MKVQTRSNMGIEGMSMMLDKLASLSPKSVDKTAVPATKSSSVDAASLDKLCAAKKEETAPEGTLREGDALKQSQELEVAKLKGRQLGESKALYAKQEGEKSKFKAQQDAEKTKFEADHKGDKDIVAKRMKFIDGQAKARAKFEAGHIEENKALAARFNEQNAHQAKWHSMQKKELEAKYAPAVKPAAPKAKAASPAVAAKSATISVKTLHLSRTGTLSA